MAWEKNYACNAILANFRNSKFRVLKPTPLKRNLVVEIQTYSKTTWGSLL
jgi:hypothetical protein